MGQFIAGFLVGGFMGLIVGIFLHVLLRVSEDEKVKMKNRYFHFGIVALFSLVLGIFLGSEIGISVADNLGKFIEIEVDVTAYSPSPAHTQGDPFRTASNLIVTSQDLEQLKYVALSRDLLKEYNIEWGDTVWIGFQIEDKMGPKATQGVDIFMRSIELARKFGRQDRTIIIERRK